MTTPEKPDALTDPDIDTSNESTPLADETQQKADDGEIPFDAKSYKVDVERALERKTDDGKGDEEVPESDFDSYATDEVEKAD